MEGLDKNTTEVIVALIGLTGALLTAFLTKKKLGATQRKLKTAEDHLEYYRNKTRFVDFAEDFLIILQDLKAILDNTELDRFILFEAKNGTSDPTHASLIFQIRGNVDELYGYKNIEIDDDFRARLKKTKIHGHVFLYVKEISSSLIKNIFETEGIQSSAWFHIGCQTIIGTKSESHIFCYFASSTEIDPDSHSLTKAQMAVDRLKILVRDFNELADSKR